MARTGFCDPKALLDLDMKVDERRAPLQVWPCGPFDCWQPLGAEESRMAVVKVEPQHEWERKHLQTSERFIMGFHQDSRPSGVMVTGCVEEHGLLYPHGLQALHSLQALVPSLLRHEVEMALEKLGLIWDRTYAWDVFSIMMKSQTRYSFAHNEFPRHFTDTTRVILVDWIIQVHEMLNFQEETLYLAIHLLNRALRLIKVTTANLQLLGMVCLFLAAKKEESILPDASGLCYLMDYTYTKHQLLRMERKVLYGLKFELSHCPPLHFLLLFATIARCSAMVVWMARYLLELSLLENHCVVFPPVQLAGAALCLARQVLQEPPTPEGEAAWCLACSIHIGSESALLKIMQILASAAAKAHAEETSATYIKFSSPETMHISSHPGLTNVSSLPAGCM